MIPKRFHDTRPGVDIVVRAADPYIHGMGNAVDKAFLEAIGEQNG